MFSPLRYENDLLKNMGSAFIINYDKEIIVPCEKGYYIEAVVRSQVHIARISRRLLKEKKPNEIKIIDKIHERDLYNTLFFSGVVNTILYNKLIKLWKERCIYAHKLESVNISKRQSIQLVIESLKIIEKLDNGKLKKFIDRLSALL